MHMKGNSTAYKQENTNAMQNLVLSDEGLTKKERFNLLYTKLVAATSGGCFS